MRLYCCGIRKPAIPVTISSGARTINVFWLSVLFSIFVKPGASVRLVDEFDWVTDLHVHLGQLTARPDLHLTTGVAGDYDIGLDHVEDRKSTRLNSSH